MSKQRRYVKNARSRDAPRRRDEASASEETKPSGVLLTDPDAWKILCSEGYKPVISCPEVQMCISVYADLISSMTIHLMQNTEKGDIRVKNELSRMLDITPSRHMTRYSFMQTLVRTLMGEGNGNQVTLPTYHDGYLENLTPLPPLEVTFAADPTGDGYTIRWRGHIFREDEALHFVLNPDPSQPWRGRGFSANLKDVVDSLRQSNATKKALLESPAPSIIVKVDGLTDEYANRNGRRTLAREYAESMEDGRPWMIPGEAFDVVQVKPLTLNDLAIKTNLELDKRSIAAIFGVPPFLVGIGDFKQDEYQHFLTTRVMAVAREIEQVLTKGLLYSPDLYWRFNARSLYNYALSDLINAGKEMVDRAAMRRNEWRDWLGMPPDPEMDEMYLLENYLPTNMLAQQKKLKGNSEDEGGENDEQQEE